MLLHLKAPDLTEVSIGDPTLWLLEAVGFSSDGRTALVRATFTDSADSSSTLLSGIWTYDLSTQAYTACLNTLVAGRVADTANYEVLNAALAGSGDDTLLVVESRIRGADAADTRLSMVRDVALSPDLLAAVPGLLGVRRIEKFAVSPDARFLAVQTDSPLLAPEGEPDTNDSSDIYMIDLLTGQVERVSFVGGAEVQAPVKLGNVVSVNGQVKVAFTSTASFVAADKNESADSTQAQTDAYLWTSAYDQHGLVGTATFELLSRTQNGTASGYVEAESALATTGRAFFTSSSEFLIAGDFNTAKDIFQFDPDRTISRIELAGIDELSAGATLAGVSGDGAEIVFLTTSSEVTGRDDIQQLVAFEVSSQSWRIVSEGLAGAANDYVSLGAVSPDAKVYAFTTTADNLTPDFSGGAAINGDLFIQFNSPPTTSLVLLDAILEDGGPVTITPALLLANAVDADGDPLTVTDLVASSGTLVSNADGSWSFTPAENVITPVNFSYSIGDGATTVTGSARLPLIPVNEPATGTLAVSGTAAEGGTLSASLTDVTDPDGATSTAWQWQSSSDGSTGWIDLSGATNSSYTIAADQSQVGQYLRVVATTTDVLGGTTIFTGAASVAIANVDDAPTGTVKISGTAEQGQTLTASNTLADADGMGEISYQWNADGVELNGATGSTYTLTQAEVGKLITVTASYTDGGGKFERVTSAATSPVEVMDVEPTDSGIVIDGYVSGAMVSRENGSGNTVTTDASGNFSGLTGTGPIIVTGGTDIVTGQAVGFTMRAPEGAAVISPLTTLVQALVDGGATPAAAYDSVAAKLGLTATQLQSDPWANLGVEDLAVIKSAVQVANLLRAAVTEGADGRLAAAALINALKSVNDLSEPMMVAAFFADPALGIGNAGTLAETLAQANAGVAAATTVDKIEDAQSRPSVTISLSDIALNVGESATVTLTFSEAPQGFDLVDIQAENGTLSNLQLRADSGGLVYTATYTPLAGVTDTTNLIAVGTEWTDSVGNAPAAITTSGNYEIDTVAPAVLSDLTGQVLTRKGQALPDFEAKLTLSTLDQLDVTLLQESVEEGGSRTLRVALTLDSAEQTFGAFDLALRTEAGVEIVGLTLGDAFEDWVSEVNIPSGAQQLDIGAISNDFSEANYASGSVMLGELEIKVSADHAGLVRISVDQLIVDKGLTQVGVLRFGQTPGVGEGEFAFLGLEDGQIDLSFVGGISAIENNAITAHDALEALRLAVLIPSAYSDSYGLIAADYNQDGRVSARDALEILRASVGLDTANKPQWVFLSNDADLTSITSRNTWYESGLTLEGLPLDASHNFTAVLLGDVNNSLDYYSWPVV